MSDEVRDQVLSFRMTQEEADILDFVCRGMKMNRSEFIRLIIKQLVNSEEIRKMEAERETAH